MLRKFKATCLVSLITNVLNGHGSTETIPLDSVDDLGQLSQYLVTHIDNSSVSAW